MDVLSEISMDLKLSDASTGLHCLGGGLSSGCRLGGLVGQRQLRLAQEHRGDHMRRLKEDLN